MRLRNKKTGLVTYWCIDKNVIRTCDGSIVYDTIAELNEEWEDAEELKKYWYFDDIDDSVYETEDREWISDINRKSIGNYFETKEEAEKAVEKLKAWKRLKDKGFSIDGYTNDIGDNFYIPSDFVIKLNYNGDHRKKYSDDVFKDLDLLFGGEE